MEKHQQLNSVVFEETATRYIEFFSYCLNEYSGHTSPSFKSDDIGNERFVELLVRLNEFGVNGLVVEGDIAPADLDDITNFAKVEKVFGSLEMNTVCSTLQYAFSGRLKLCLFEGLPLEDIYETEFHLNDEDMLTVNELTALANTSEGAVRNELSKMPLSSFSTSYSGKQALKIEEAAKWLRLRKEFKPTKNLSGMTGDTSEFVNVPVASDGTYFSYGCAYKRGGFQVGEKGDEIKIDSFDEALKVLLEMPLAKWRRPNAAGNYGIVSAVEWRRLKRSDLKITLEKQRTALDLK